MARAKIRKGAAWVTITDEDHRAAADPHTGYATDADLTAHAGAADPHTGYQQEAEKGVASGYASLGADGLVPQEQLGSGTQDGTKFLRDDGTWQVGAGVDYIASRAAELLTNGSGLLGSNYNFPNFVFDPVQVKSGGGSFRADANGTFISTEKMPVDIEREYVLSAWVKQLLTDKTMYLGLSAYDIDDNQIGPQSFMIVAGSAQTTLAAALTPGDTTVTLASSTGWHNGTTGHMRSIRIEKYRNSKGYEYPARRYSRHWISDAWASGGINTTTHVITLAAPWPASLGNPDDVNGTWPVGTPVSNAQSGSVYKYIAASNAAPPADWTRYQGTIGGVDAIGGNDTRKFPFATAWVRVVVLPNYGYTTGDNKQWYSNLSFAGYPISDTWHEVGATGEPAFTNAWVNYGSPWETAAFRRDANGFVHLKGLIRSGTIGSSAFTLPVGYRPAQSGIYSVLSYNGTAYVVSRADALLDGTVVPRAGANTFFSLAGITFLAEG